MDISSYLIVLLFFFIAGATSQYYPAVQSSPSNVPEAVKRDGIGKGFVQLLLLSWPEPFRGDKKLIYATPDSLFR